MVRVCPSGERRLSSFASAAAKQVQPDERATLRPQTASLPADAARKLLGWKPIERASSSFSRSPVRVQKESETE